MMFLLYSFIILTGILLSGSQSQDTDICTMEGTKKLCVQRDVIGVRGEDVILPCRFNHSEGNNVTNLRLYWFKYYNNRDNNIFRSSTNNTQGGFKGRIQTVGSPSEGDGTVRIRDLKMEDEGTYRCRFKFTQKKQRRTRYRVRFYPSKEKRTRLRVDVRPKILDVWREFVNSSTSWRLFCEAEAKPGPNITWWNPQGLIINGSETVVSPNNQNDSQKIISSYNITREDPEGNYSCLVQNQHGTGKGFVFYGEFEGTRGITGIIIGCTSAIILVLLLLFVLIYCIYNKHRNPAEGNSTQPDVELHESGQRQESSYMGLKKRRRDESQSQLYETL